MTNNGNILWVDDEIELLKAHILFLEKKGYDVTTVSNGADAIDQCHQHTFDLIMLDEMMPGLSGLETLQQIKDISPATPVVMVTKSEEENIMEQAIGSKIADYLIKPVNPSQILLSLKKNIHRKEIVTEVTQNSYQQNFQQLSLQIEDCRNFEDWKTVYKKLVHWELELSSADSSMTEILKTQKEEADNAFAKFIKKNYMDWVSPQKTSGIGNMRNMMQHKLASRHSMPTSQTEDKPLMSPDVFKRKVFPLLDNKEKVFLIVIDNFRYDQWRVLAQEIGDMFDMAEDLYMSILPTATQYARNAIFSGLMPTQIASMFPELWVDEDEEEGKNLNEAPLIRTQIERYRRHDTFSYHKINDSNGAEKFMQFLPNLKQNDLNVLVINFIDMLSHARTESRMVRELASNESAYRSITQSWLRHSFMAELFKQLAASQYKIIITTDHGSIRASKPVKIIGDRNTNTNLRYKLGKNLNYDSKDVFAIKEPAKAQLPTLNLSTSYVFATGDSFFAYPNNYNYYVSYYKNTFQHGGISMEEMLIPIVTLTPRRR
ncbi:MAG: PglZ domain-containing protein [Prevotella sp.]|nr:PglZ domain-containing protein [Prevotella sp.]MDD7047332.1 bifunctional response regulator/alkaline phosphatase family protein [Prevotella sp.]MDY5547504.1 bifunctional response regulator/alkaline phosphatase family protein [Prevotella sp.]